MKQLDQRVLSAGAWWVRFIWRGDRWGHEIALADAGHPADWLLRSREGTPEEDWPGSPPLQQLDPAEVGPGVTAMLLVGLAGKSHWSLSVHVEPASGRLVFDAACRHAGPAGWLGSSYELAGGLSPDEELTAAEASSEHGQRTNAAWRVVGCVRAVDGAKRVTRVLIETAGDEAACDWTGSADEAGLAEGSERFSPARPLPSGTTRWRYGLRLA